MIRALHYRHQWQRGKLPGKRVAETACLRVPGCTAFPYYRSQGLKFRRVWCAHGDAEVTV
jgi:hypothetical protein